MTLAAVQNDTATGNGQGFTKYPFGVALTKGARAIREERDRMLDAALTSTIPQWHLETALALHQAIKVLEDAQD
jgi:hypothetical protein